MSDGQIVIGGKAYDITLTERPSPVPVPVPRPVPDPAPVPVPAPRQGRVRALWRFGWKNIDPASWPVDVQSSVNCVILAMSQSAAPGTGRLTMPPATSRAMVTRLTSTGADVFAGIGGSGDGGITILTPGQVSEAAASVRQMRDALGVTGIVLDLEGTPGQRWTVDSMTSFARAVIADGLKVGVWSALYGGRLEAWGAVCRALGQDLHHWERGFYDFGEAADGRLTGIAVSDVAAMRRFVACEDQIVASFMPKPVQPYPNASPVPVISAAYAAVRAKYPDVGWSVWEDQIEAATGWGAIRALAKL